MGGEAGVEIHRAALVVLGLAIATDRQLLLFPIDVGPAEVKSLFAPTPTECHQAHVVRELLPESS